MQPHFETVLPPDKYAEYIEIGFEVGYFCDKVSKLIRKFYYAHNPN